MLALHAESWWRVAQREFENGYYNLHINWRVSVQSVVSWDWTVLADSARQSWTNLAAAACKSWTYRRWPPVSPGVTGGGRQEVEILQAESANPVQSQLPTDFIR